jgi:hypothetical protein
MKPTKNGIPVNRIVGEVYYFLGILVGILISKWWWTLPIAVVLQSTWLVLRHGFRVDMREWDAEARGETCAKNGICHEAFLQNLQKKSPLRGIRQSSLRDSELN